MYNKRRKTTEQIGRRMTKILYISLVDWFWIKQRPQQISEYLSKYNELTYFCIRSWFTHPNIQFQHHQNDRSDLNKTRFQRGTLSIIRKRLIPKNSLKFIYRLNNRLMKMRLFMLDHKHHYDVVILTNPNQLNFLPNKLLHKRVIYDCMDNYVQFDINKEQLSKNESVIVNLASDIIVSSAALERHLIDTYFIPELKITIINNAVDLDTFDHTRQELSSPRIKLSGQFKLGYIGTLSAWFDQDLIRVMAEKFREIDIHLIGPIEKNTDFRRLSDLPNVHLYGTAPYSEVPMLLSQFDIAIMPFTITPLVQTVNPVKIYEYLSLHKQVFVPYYPELDQFKEYVYFYSSQTEFESLIGSFISGKIKPKPIPNEDYFKMNSWENRAQSFQKIINK